MFRQDFTCPALLKSNHHTDSYGAITHDACFSKTVPMTIRLALAWSAFARHY
jgi:hypothetical protein